MTSQHVSPLLQNNRQSHLLFGEVQAVTEHGYIIHQHQAGSVMALKAFSCTYTPVTGDWVSFLPSPDGQNYILDILRRQSDEMASIENNNGIRLSSAADISLQSSQLNIVNTETQLTTLQTRMNSQALDVHASKASFKAESAESSIGQMIARMRDSIRIIERIEQVKAKDLIQNVKNLFLQRSEQADISAKKDVKINGDRIHMG